VYIQKEQILFSMSQNNTLSAFKINLNKKMQKMTKLLDNPTKPP